MSLEEQIAPLIASAGAKLYDTEIANEAGRKIFRVFIDSEGGADVELCARISRLLSPFLDVTPPIDGEYVLEVSSPGIERHLRTIEHFQGAIGEAIKVFLRDKTRIKGVLRGVENDTVLIEGAAALIAVSSIVKARVLYSPKPERGK